MMNVSDEAPPKEIPDMTGSDVTATGDVAVLEIERDRSESMDQTMNMAQELPKDSPKVDLPPGFFKDMPKPEHKRSESAGEVAQRKIDQYHSASKLVKPERKGSVEMLNWTDVELGRLLDKGSFSCVYEGTLSRDRVDPKPIYAVKCLRENVTEQEDTFVMGAVDLALEASILSKLMHVNVIRIHGYSGSISQSFSESDRGFFLVLELLFDTCDKRLDRWRREKADSKFSRQKNERKRRLRERIEDLALGVADGMAYIHSRNIIYRDLKPHNIGWNEAGEVKIFDFGLARESDSLGNLRHMTGNAGTPRYMAPEVARDEKYGFPSDVYSFSILLWEIVTLDRPFDSVKSLPQFNEEVVRRHLRPPLKKVYELELKTLLEQAWDKDQEKRPSFSEISQVLREYVTRTEPKPPAFRRYLSSLSTKAEAGSTLGVVGYDHERHDSSGVETQPTSSLMSSRRTNESDQETERRSPRLLACCPWLRKTPEVTEPPITESHLYQERTWVQRKLLRKATMRLDLSTREYRIRKYDLGRPGSFRSSGSVHSSNEFQKASRRPSVNSVASDERPKRRRSSAKSESKHIEAIAAALAAEAKSNRQVLREMKRAGKNGKK